MTTDKARSLTEQIEASVNQLATETDEARQGELFQTWLNAMAQFSHYSWNNQLLIACQRPAASSGQVAGFNAWRKLGRHVKKGAKGIAILAPASIAKKPMTPKKTAPPSSASLDSKPPTFFVSQIPKGNLYRPSPTAPNPAAKNYSDASNGSPREVLTSFSTTKKSKKTASKAIPPAAASSSVPACRPRPSGGRGA